MEFWRYIAKNHLDENSSRFLPDLCRLVKLSDKGTSIFAVEISKVVHLFPKFKRKFALFIKLSAETLVAFADYFTNIGKIYIFKDNFTYF